MYRDKCLTLRRLGVDYAPYYAEDVCLNCPLDFCVYDKDYRYPENKRGIEDANVLTVFCSKLRYFVDLLV